MKELDIPPQRNPYGIPPPEQYGLLGEGQREPTPEEVEQFKQAMLEEAQREEAEQKAREAAAIEAEARAEKVRQDKAEVASIKVEKERVVEKEHATHVEKVSIIPLETVELPGPVAFGRKPAGGAPVPEPETPVLASERRERGDRRPDDPESTLTVTQATELQVVAPSGYRVPGKPEPVKTDAGVLAVAGVTPAVHAQLKDGVPVVEKSEILIAPEGTTLVVPPGTPEFVPDNAGIPVTASLETAAFEPIPSEPVAFGTPTPALHASPAIPPGAFPGTVPQVLPGEPATVAALPGIPIPDSEKGSPPIPASPETVALEPIPSEPEGFGNPPRGNPTQTLYAAPTELPGTVPGAIPQAAPEGIVLEGFPPVPGKVETLAVVPGPVTPVDTRYSLPIEGAPGPGPVQPTPLVLSRTDLPGPDAPVATLESPLSGNGKTLQPGFPAEAPVLPLDSGEEVVAVVPYTVEDPVADLPAGRNTLVTPGSDSPDVQPEFILAAAPERGKTAAPPVGLDLSFEGGLPIEAELPVVADRPSETELPIEADLPFVAEEPIEGFVNPAPENTVTPEERTEEPIPGAAPAEGGEAETEALLPSGVVDETIATPPEGSPLEKPKEGAPTREESEFMAAEADDDNVADKPVFNLAAPTEFNEREVPVAGEEDGLLEGAGRIEQTEREEADFWSRKETETDLEDTDRDLDKETEFVIRKNEEIAEAEDPAALEAAYPILPATWGVNVETSPLPPVPQQPPGGSPLTQEIISLVSRVLVTDDPYSQAPEMRLTLHESVLPGTEIRFRTEGGVLEVTLYSETGESADTLRAEAPELESALESTTGGQVRVTVVSGNDPWDGRG